MKLKLDADGHVIVENGMPVYIFSDGKEAPFDAAYAMSKISALNGENKSHREAKEALEQKLSEFADIDDPIKAKEAIDIVAKLDQKKLIDAGAVDQVKAEITKVYEKKLTEATQRADRLERQYYEEKIGGAFGSSEFIKEKLAIPADFVRARFGQNFKMEEGKIVAYDNQGNRIFSRSKAGEPAGFDEALELLVEAYPQKDHILKAVNSSGSDSHRTQADVGQKTMRRIDFDALDGIARSQAVANGFTVVD